jgi:glycosyltransferase involved in cell wall biosynthesis
VPNDALLVGSMFRFAPEKRPLLWLDAAAAILEQRTDAMFVLYGTGPLTAEMRERASSLGLEPRLRLPGLSLDPVAAIGGMDVLVLTSEAEGTPNVVIEAQWAGTPVVACTGGGVAEAFVPGETGILVPSADPGSIAEAALRIGADLAWRERVRRAGPAFVASRFGFDRMIDALVAQYGFGERAKG